MHFLFIPRCIVSCFQRRPKLLLVMWSSMLLVLMSVSLLFSPSMCLNDIKLGLGSCVATFWERAAHSVNRLSLCIVYA